MINLNPFAISGLLIIVTHLPLFLLIFFKGKTKIAQIFSFHIFAIFCWGIFAFLLGISPEKYTLLITKFGIISVYLIPVFFLHAILVLTNKSSRLLISLIYSQAIVFYILALTDKIFVSNKLVFNSFYYPQGNILFLISFMFWMTNVIVGQLLLIRYYWFKYPKQTKQIRFLSISLPIHMWVGAMNFLPALGLNIYPIGNFVLPVYTLITAYAILKHQILNIEIELKKGIVYSILVTIISALFLLVIVLLEKLLQSFTGYNSILLSIFSAFLLCLLFTPLRNKIQHIVDKIFFRGSQEEISEENERLRQEIAQSDRLKAVATLASGMAHEIKNPLTALKTFSEYLPEKKNDPEFLDKFSKIVGSEVGRIDDLVHRLLDFAKPAPPQLKKTNIHELLDNTLDFLNSKLIKHKISVQKQYSVQSGMLNVDPNQIRQVLLNVLLNAIEAMENDGTLTVRTQAMAHGSLEITIQDTGPGIFPKDLPHIFDPFFTKKEGGTGLGLAITHGIIKEHGGNISVRSKLGEGTTFTIELPLNPA